MSYGYPGQGHYGAEHHGGGGGGYGYEQGGYGGGDYHRPPPGPPPAEHGSGYGYGGYQQGGHGGYEQRSSYKPPPPPYPPPAGLDAYGYPLRHPPPSARYARAGPPPPSGAQQFGHGAPEGYTFQYSNCTGKRKALLIGINYFGQNGELRGCINDVHNLSTYLIEKWNYKREDMVQLTDDNPDPVMQPTKENIVRAMKWLVKDAQPNDSLFLHYSGLLPPLCILLYASRFLMAMPGCIC